MSKVSERLLSRLEARAPSIGWRYISSKVSPVLLPLWFTLYCGLLLNNLGAHGFLFLDVAVYREAAQHALAGQSPWEATVDGLRFAGPPPTVLLYLPTALVPLPLAIGTVTLTLDGSALWAIRRLKLPLWWVLFPPIFESIIVGNPDVLVLALLLVRGPIAGLSVIAKVYAVIPLIVQRRVRPLAVATVFGALSLPLWPDFLSNLDAVTHALDEQSRGYSAWGTWFVVPVVLALWILRRRGAEWLVVPAIWPNTQTHYGAMSLPVVARYPVAAAVMGLQIPLAPAIAVVIIAVQATWWPPKPDISRLQ